MTAYVDTSVLIDWVLERNMVLEQAVAAGAVATSELALIEGNRVLDRHRLIGELDDEGAGVVKGLFRRLVGGMVLLPLDDQVKRRAAASFPTVIGTLDAIHLASAELWSQGTGEDVAVFSLDRQMNTCAKAMGLATPLG